MRTAAVVALSAAAHLGLLALLPPPGHRLALPKAAPVDVVEVEAPTPPVDAVPIEFVELPDAEAPGSGLQAPGPGTERGSLAVRQSLGAEPGAGSLEPGASDDGKATKGLGMRDDAWRNRPAPITWSPTGAIAAILDKPPPEEVPETGMVEANKDGTYTGRDLTFTAHFNPDGTVASIDDKPNFHIKLHIPHPKKIWRAMKHHVAAWAEDPYGVATGAPTKEPGGGHPGDPNDDDGDGKNDDGDTVTILSGGFDVTDAIMRMAGQDPYAARKRVFLEKTFDERVQIGTAYRAEQLEQSDQLMLKNLKELWARTDLTSAEKRELIFELWDECAETGGEQLVAGGKKARAAVKRFVRVHLPSDGADAFTADEIDAFNDRRKSSVRFAPYDD